MFEQIIASNEIKFNELEKKIFKFVCFFGCLILKLLLESEVLNISTEGKVSSNLAQKVIETVPVTDSYRKAEKVIEGITNTTLSHEKIRNIVVKIGERITNQKR